MNWNRLNSGWFCLIEVQGRRQEATACTASVLIEQNVHLFFSRLVLLCTENELDSIENHHHHHDDDWIEWLNVFEPFSIVTLQAPKTKPIKPTVSQSVQSWTRRLIGQLNWSTLCLLACLPTIVPSIHCNPRVNEEWVDEHLVALQLCKRLHNPGNLIRRRCWAINLVESRRRRR